MRALSLRRQRGVAVPVMLIILTVLLIGGLYLMRSSNTTTLTTSNLAYDNAMSRATDIGLHKAYQWLLNTSVANKAALDNDDAANGYKASLDTNLKVSDPDFWAGSVKVTDSESRQVEYIVHRMCSLTGSFSSISPQNTCVQTAPTGNASTTGNSLATGTTVYLSNPELHYVITSRIYGVRGGNVVNQAVVMIGT